MLKPSTVHQELRVLRHILNVAVRKKLLASNPCWGVEFPVAVKGLFRPHYVSWSEQQRIEAAASIYLRNVVRIITETGLRIYKELTPMKKDQVDLENKVVWISDSKTPNGVGEVPLTDLAVEAIRDQMQRAGNSLYLFPRENAVGHRRRSRRRGGRRFVERRCRTFASTICARPMRRRLSAGGVADEWVTQLLRQGDAKVFKKYSQMKLQMKREALQRLNRAANESAGVLGQAG